MEFDSVDTHRIFYLDLVFIVKSLLNIYSPSLNSPRKLTWSISIDVVERGKRGIRTTTNLKKTII